MIRSIRIQNQRINKWGIRKTAYKITSMSNCGWGWCLWYLILQELLILILRLHMLFCVLGLRTRYRTHDQIRSQWSHEIQMSRTTPAVRSLEREWTSLWQLGFLRLLIRPSEPSFLIPTWNQKDWRICVFLIKLNVQRIHAYIETRSQK